MFFSSLSFTLIISVLLISMIMPINKMMSFDDILTLTTIIYWHNVITKKCYKHAIQNITTFINQKNSLPAIMH